MRKCVIIVSIFLYCAVINAQEGWYYQTPRGIKAITFLDGNNMIAVGTGIWKSTDFGNSWTGKALGFKFRDGEVLHYINKVDFHSSTLGYCVGSNGIIMKSVNGGNSWEKLDGPSLNPQTTIYTDVAVVSTNKVVIIGQIEVGITTKSVVIISNDGGDNWAVVKTDQGVEYNDLDFVDVNNGWIAANGKKALKTTDGGLNWTTFSLPSSIGSNYSYALDFIDANNGLISTGLASQVVRTTDGGNSWEVISISVGGSAFSTSLVYFPTGTAYMMKIGGALMKSSNHGTSWIDVSTVPDGYGDKIVFESTSKGIAFNTGSNVINHTENSGQNWDRKEWDSRSIYNFDQNYGWAGNEDYLNPSRCLLRTTNGQTWQMIAVDSDIPDVQALFFFDFKSASLGYAVANHKITPSTYTTSIVKTTNGGLYWKKLRTTANINNLFMLNEQYGWSVHSNGQIYKTLDGGTTWGSQTTNTSTYLSGLHFNDENNGFACGWAGTFLRTTNGGLLWNSITIPGYQTAEFGTLKFFDAFTGYMTGRLNFLPFILKTADGGLTWTNVTPPGLDGDYYGIQLQVKSTSNVFVSAPYLGAIKHTVDGGGSWQDIPFVTASSSSSMSYSVINSDRIYISQSGSIIFTENGGITGIEEELHCGIPDNFEVCQNYPNPFNPSTNIRFSLPYDMYVSGRVYDISGREVTLVIDGEIAAGQHNINFDASSLNSGVYFFRLSGENFTKTIKMLLLK